MAGEDIRVGGAYLELEVRYKNWEAANAAVATLERETVSAGAKAGASMATLSNQATKTAGAVKQEGDAAHLAAKRIAELEAANAAASKTSAELAGRVEKLEQRLAAKTKASNDASKAANKVQNGLVSIALSSTQASGALGSIVQGMLLFGAGATAVLGAAAAVVVLSKGYQLLTEDSRRAAEQVKKVREAQAQAREDAKTPQERASESINTLVQERIRLTEEIAAKQRELASVAGDDRRLGEAQSLQGQITALKAERDKVQEDIKTAQGTRGRATGDARAEDLRTLTEARRLGVASQADLLRERELVAGLRAIEADTTKPLKERVEARRTLAELAQAERDRAKQLRDIVFAGEQAAADMTRDVVDNAELALRRFEAEAQASIERIGSAADRETARRAFAQQRVPLQENIVAARALDTVGPAERFDNIDRINEAMSQLVLTQRDLTKYGQAYEAVQKRIGELEERKTALMQQELTAGKIIADRAEQQRKAEEAKAKHAAAGRLNQEQIAELVRDATRGALQLAQAFGLVGAETAQILQDITNLATDLPKLASSIRSLQSGKGSIGEVLGSALSVTGAIASLAGALFGGDSAADRERRQRQLENTKAIQKLTDTIGELGLPGVTGAAFADAQAAVAAFDVDAVRRGQRPTARPGSDAWRLQNQLFQLVDANKLEAQLRASGTSRQELQDLANSLGLQVDFFTDNVHTLQDAFKQLNAALKETQLTKFAETFSGQLSALQLEEQALRITDPVQILERRRDLLARGPATEGGDPLGSPALARALAGLDLNTAEGRAQAQANIAAVVQALRDGTLKPEDLGGLDAEQFQSAIRDILSLLEDADQRARGGEDTSSFSVARTITTGQADQLIGLAVTANVYLSEISLGVTQLRDIVGGALLAFAGIQPPALPGGTSTTGAGGVVVTITGGISVTIVAGPGADPALLGAQAADQVVTGLLDQLGKDYRLRRLMNGQAGVS